jgi:hypothetical protein
VVNGPHGHNSCFFSQSPWPDCKSLPHNNFSLGTNVKMSLRRRFGAHLQRLTSYPANFCAKLANFRRAGQSAAFALAEGPPTCPKSPSTLSGHVALSRHLDYIRAKTSKLLDRLLMFILANAVRKPPNRTQRMMRQRFVMRRFVLIPPLCGPDLENCSPLRGRPAGMSRTTGKLSSCAACKLGTSAAGIRGGFRLDYYSFS